MKNFKRYFENYVKNLLATALITGSAITLPIQRISSSTELPKKYTLEEIKEISRGLEEKIAFEENRQLTYKEREKLLAYVFNEVDSLPPYLDKNYVRAKASVESTWYPRAASKAGAKGIMQVTEPTWSDHDSTSYEENVFNPEKNMLVGVKYLKYLDEYLQKNFPGYSELSYEERQEKISIAYNLGIGNAQEANWNIKDMPLETQNHVEKIKRILRKG